MRVRLDRERTEGWLTMKGRRVEGAALEIELPMTAADAHAALGLAIARIEKRRWRMRAGALVIEVDEFLGPLAGFVFAESELPSAD